MRTNALRIARRHFALEGSSSRVSNTGGVTRTISTGKHRNLSSIVAVRSEDTTEHDGPSTQHQRVRKALNGAIKSSTKKRAAVSSPIRAEPQNKPEVVSEKAAKEKSDVTAQDDEAPPYVSPTHLMYTGGTSMPLTSILKIVEPGHDVPRGIWPVFRIMVSSRFALSFICLYIVYSSSRALSVIHC